MALFGYLSSLEKQAKEASFQKVFDFIRTTDIQSVFDTVSPGNNVTVEIDGQSIFAIFQEYDSRLHENCKPEYHRIYTDLQYIHQGSEIIGVAGLKDITIPDNYDADKDIAFPHVSHLSHLVLTPGTGAILYPDDVHSPGMAVENKPMRVKKIVFKLKL